jgi:hypothetical protein
MNQKLTETNPKKQALEDDAILRHTPMMQHYPRMTF